MKLLLSLLPIIAVFTVNCLGFPDEPDGRDSADEGQLLGKTSAIIKVNPDLLLEESKEKMSFGDLESSVERGSGTPSIACEAAGGYCIKGKQECTGIIDPKGCNGRRWKCCIPDVEPPTCPSCPTCPTCPTKGFTGNTVLEWNFVGEDTFVRSSERMSWGKAEEFCRFFDLQLYQPKNVLQVSNYLADNFENDHGRTYIGGRGNGTHQLWLSGEVVSNDEPWANTDYSSFARTTSCLAIGLHKTYMEKGQVLWATPCNHVNNLDYVLCGEPEAYTLSWHYIGEEQFARYNHMMDWEDSRALCKSFGLDLYQAKNLTALLEILVDITRADNAAADTIPYNQVWHWIGATTDGSKITTWLSGEEIPADSSDWHKGYPARDRCVATTYIGIFSSACTNKYLYPLCG